MKKSSFVAMILGTVGGILFALGMCMALIPEWNAFNQGIIHGCNRGCSAAGHGAGVEEDGEEKPDPPVRKDHRYHASWDCRRTCAGVGMCLTMVWSNMIVGVVVGLVGIILLLCLIPLTKGLK